LSLLDNPFGGKPPPRSQEGCRNTHDSKTYDNNNTSCEKTADPKESGSPVTTVQNPATKPAKDQTRHVQPEQRPKHSAQQKVTGNRMEKDKIRANNDSPERSPMSYKR